MSHFKTENTEANNVDDTWQLAGDILQMDTVMKKDPQFNTI